MDEVCCDVCGEPWGIPTRAHECKVVPPMRDTATLLELLEAEHQHWAAVRELHRDDVQSRDWYHADRTLGHIEALQRIYSEAARES